MPFKIISWRIFLFMLLKIFICFKLRSAAKVCPDISVMFISVQLSSINPYYPGVKVSVLVVAEICLKISEKLITNISKSVMSTTMPSL